jgi:adenylyl-sulfate kinase
LVGAADGDGYERFRASEADADARLAEAASGRALCVWMTGLSGSGKSTISGVLSSCLRAQGLPCYSLDGDVLRRGLNRDLGFTDADRSENIRRTAEVARLMVDAGLIVIVSLISPFRVDRAFARSCFASDRFCEVFVDAPLAVCEQRDPKGLYAKARRGELARMTGIDSPYEPPEQPELHLHTDADNALECGEEVLSWLIGSGLISGRAPMAQVRVAAERR